MRRALLALLTTAATVAVTAPAAAQSRRPLLGRVVDDRGKPVADAEVHCLMSPLGSERNRALDDMKVMSDQRGRFRFQVWPCTRQFLWAIGPADDDGKRSYSELQWGAAGRLIDIKLGEPHEPTTVLVKGLDEWAEHGPFRLRVCVGGIEIDGLEFPVDEDGECTLPMLPKKLMYADVLDKNGQPLQSIRISSNKPTIRATMHPPQKVPMRVVDAQGKPLAGALIRQRMSAGYVSSTGLSISMPSREIFREIGTTDANGKLEAYIAERSDPFTKTGWQRLFFIATLDGHNASHSGFRRHPFHDGKELERDGLEELKFTLGKAKPIRGRLTRGGNPVANEALTAKLQIRIENLKGNGWTHEHFLQRVQTDGEGRFEFTGMQGKVDGATLVLGSDGIAPSLVPEGLHRQLPYRAIALHQTKIIEGKQFDIDLADCHRIEMQLLDEVGGPAASAEVLLLSKANGDNVDCNDWTPYLTTDSAGRATLLAQRGDWLLFARGKNGMVHRTLDLDGDQRLDLKLGPMPTMRGRVVDAEGKPIANARMNVHSSSWSWGGDNQDRALMAVGNRLNWGWIDNTMTDKDGNFSCSFLECEGMSYEARFEFGKKKSKDFQITVSEQPIIITIE